jgi:ribosomal protein S18 acetylase RimI-like enzyme
VRNFPFGRAYFNDGLPSVWDRNFVLVERDSEPPDALSVETAADVLQGSAGLRHRKVVFEDEAIGSRLTGALAARGWAVQRLSVLVHRGAAAPGAPGNEAAEVDRASLEGAVVKLLRPEPYGADEAIVRQFAKADIAVSRTLEQRCFARLVDGAAVSLCRLFSDGEVGQIEDVATLPESRGRGYARAVLSKAIAEARLANGLTFLLAVDGLWVKHWYERLGFEQIALRYEVTRGGDG